MRIQSSEVRLWFEAIMSHYESTHGGSIELDDDYFWDIPAEARYQIENRPSEITIGQLSENVELLRRSAALGDEMSYDFVWLAGLLAYLGTKKVT